MPSRSPRRARRAGGAGGLEQALCRRWTAGRPLHAGDTPSSCRRTTPTSGAPGKARCRIARSTRFASRRPRPAGGRSTSRSPARGARRHARSEHRRRASRRSIGGLASVIMPALMVLGAVLARSNVKAGRGDREGALRVAAFVFGASLVAWALGASHIPSPSASRSAGSSPLSAVALFDAGLLWVTYLGLEPYVRRHSPDSILGWTQARGRPLARPEGRRRRARRRQRRAGDDAALRRPQPSAAARRVPRADAARAERVLDERPALHPRRHRQPS